MAATPPAAPTTIPTSAPRGDEIDPELISLKRKRAGIGPVLAASVILLCGYLLITLRADLVFALASRTPTDLGDASALHAAGKRLPENQLISLRARPDLANPGWLRGKQASGHYLMAALGSSGGLWLHLLDDAVTAQPAYDLVYTGRVRSVDDLAFAAELRNYVNSQAPQPRWIAPDSLTAGAPGTLARDVHGDTLTLTADTPVELDERVAGVALVTLYTNDKVKDELGARAAITDAGLAPAAETVRTTDRSWTFQVAAPEGIPGVRAAISRGNLYAAMASDSVSEKIIRHAGLWKDVTVDAAGKQLKLANGSAFPLGSLASLVAYVDPVLPDDAQILLAGERPGDYWYIGPLYALLAIVLALMVWALVRGLRNPGDAAGGPLVIQAPDAPSDAPTSA